MQPYPKVIGLMPQWKTFRSRYKQEATERLSKLWEQWEAVWANYQRVREEYEWVREQHHRRAWIRNILGFLIYLLFGPYLILGVLLLLGAIYLAVQGSVFSLGAFLFAVGWFGGGIWGLVALFKRLRLPLPDIPSVPPQLRPFQVYDRGTFAEKLLEKAWLLAWYYLGKPSEQTFRYGTTGEQILLERLRQETLSAPTHYFVLINVPIWSGDIDALVVTTWGVAVLESKFYQGTLFLQNGQLMRQRWYPPLQEAPEPVEGIVTQVLGEARFVRQALKKASLSVSVYPALVFTHPNSEIRIASIEGVPVIHVAHLTIGRVFRLVSDQEPKIELPSMEDKIHVVESILRVARKYANGKETIETAPSYMVSEAWGWALAELSKMEKALNHFQASVAAVAEAIEKQSY